MSINNGERKKILNKVSEKKIEKETSTADAKNGESKSTTELLLFLSFDITDSTRLKVQYPKKWVKVINCLLSEKFQYMETWKFNGDEMLYKRKIRSLDFICKMIKEAYDYLERIQRQMATYINEISVKATIWIAVADQDLDKYKNNYIIKFNEMSDFVGKSIDEGFRLTKCSSMQKVAIDPKIVYILLDAYNFMIKNENAQKRVKTNNFYKSIINYNTDNITKQVSEILSNIHLIGYSKCKGVWHDNPYPIYWYYNMSKGIQFSEFLDGKHLWPDRTGSICKDVATMNDSLDNIEKIFDQLNISSEKSEIYNLLELEGEIEISSIAKANLYFMVVCINPSTGNVLIAKRCNTRKHLKNVWDFGNVKYQNIDMKGTIEREYKNTFGIDISLFTDSGRDHHIKPFGYCTIYRNCKPHNSILCYAKINFPANKRDDELIDYINNKMDKTKYSEIKFVNADDTNIFKELTLEEIRIDSEKAENNTNESYEDNFCIMYFQNSVAGAIDEFMKRNNL